MTTTDTLAEKVAHFARAKITAIVPESYEHVDRDLPTASWWDRYTILPGEYEGRLCNVGGSTWNPDPDARTPGFLANVGPDHIIFTVKARLIESYRESRLLTEVRFEQRTHDMDTTVHVHLYTFQLKDGGTFHRGHATIRVTEE